MQRAEVNVEVCHVEELVKSSDKRQTKTKSKGRSKGKRKKPKPAESDWETEAMVSGWEGEDELDASQYLPVFETGLTLVRKRSAESFTGAELGGRPVVKRPRTRLYEAD
jgi:hypothetical protein